MSKLTELTDAYVAGPAQLRAAVTGMTREQLLARPIPGKWSTMEVVCHIADFEPVYLDRIKRAIALKNPLVFVADENDFVKQLAYHDRDLEEELKLIEICRASMARILRHVPEAVLTRTAIHNEKGLVTVEQMLTGITNHIKNHMAFIVEKKKALGIA